MDRPKIICLCGSTRFPEAFALANTDITMRGNIVLSLGIMGHADQPRGAKFLASEDPTTIEMLAQLHRSKIDMSDEILVINVADYIGGSTRSEIEYASNQGIPVRYMFEHTD